MLFIDLPQPVVYWPGTNFVSVKVNMQNRKTF